MNDCATASPAGLKLICNQQAPEDLVVVPGAQWVVASAYSGTGGVNLIRVRDRVRASAPTRRRGAQAARREEVRRLPRPAR